MIIEHENRIVEQQDAFLKEIDLPELPYGTYTLFVEMLYSNTSATAKDSFTIAIL